ncbi:MAG: ATP-binding cassette domain-containing protein, partial [Longimicrobiales bacterium]
MATEREPVISFSGVSLGYGSRSVLSGLTFAIEQGDLLGLVGPNGAGKTTILRGILGTLEPRAGRITRAAGLRYGYVPQRSTLDYGWPLDTQTVVAMGAYDRIGLLRRPGPADHEAARTALE